MSELSEVAEALEADRSELSIAFSTEELVVLGRVLGVQLGVLGPSPLAAIAPRHREEVLASAARSLRARNVLTGPTDLPAVDRAVAGLVQIAARPALRAELVVDRGATLHRRYLSIPYASVQYEATSDGLHRLTPFATIDLLARTMRHANFVERPSHELSGFEVPMGALEAARAAVGESDLSGARTVLEEHEAPAPSVEGFVAALAVGNPVNAVRLVHTVSPTRSAGGEVAWTDGGDAGLWRLPTIDQPFAAVGVADGERRDDDGIDPALAAATVRVEPVSTTDLANFLFGLLPGPEG